LLRWDSENKAYFFEKRPGQALPLALEGFEPKQFSWEEKIQRKLNGGAFPTVQAGITLFNFLRISPDQLRPKFGRNSFCNLQVDLKEAVAKI